MRILPLVMISLAAAPALAKEKRAAAPGKPVPSQERYENLALFNKVLYFIEQNYVEEVKGKDLMQGAIKGMLETLDPHSNLLLAETYKDMKIDTSGKFGGLGIEMGMKDGVLTVITPIDDTPAFKAGIKAGDRIIKIDGKGTKGLSIAEAVTRLRGKKGAEVRLTIWREGFAKPKEFALKRADVTIQSVRSEALEPGYLYVRLASFNEHAAKDIKRAMDKFEGKGAKNGLMKGLILDLRNNPGGLLDQAVEVSSLFLEEGAVVSTRGRAKDAQEVKGVIQGMARGYMPMAVLVNGATASAAEIVAGALQDHKRAVVMGQPTFGKGSVQTVVEINPDMGLKLTVARYYTPQGRSIQAKGIVPDVSLDDLDQKVIDQATRKTEVRHEKDLDGHIENEDRQYSQQELESLGKEQDVEKAQAKDKDEETKAVLAKDDYQVRQALNYMKSYQVLRAMKLEPNVETIDTAGAVKRAEAPTD